MAMQEQEEPRVDRCVWSVPQFIGRRRELELIYNQYEAVRGGGSNVTLLTGEPGIGKTRLLDEVAAQAMHDGAIVLRGGALEAEGMPPYLPFLEAIGKYIRITPREIILEQIAHAPRILLNIFPELALYLDDKTLPTLPYAPLPEQARLRLYEAIGLFLENISASHVLVLILDDLHWVDSSSLDLLCYITRRYSQAKLLVIGAYREGEIDRNRALTRTQTELVRQRILTTVAVDPLSHSEIEALATNHLGGPISKDISVLLYTQSEGNPFFAEELIHGWVATKALLKSGGQWLAPTPLECTLPSSIIEALRQRLTLLAPEIINHLRVAAIIGRKFDLALLAIVEKQPIEALEEQILEAEHARLVYAEQPGIYTFHHDNIRACLYAEVSASRRRRLHETIGHVLEDRYKKENKKSAYELGAIALHFALGSNAALAATYTQQAADQALQSLAMEDTNVRRLEFVAHCQQQNAYPWLALLLSSQGSWDEAEQAVAQAYSISSPESRSFLWHMRGFLAYQQENYAAAEHHFQMARINRHTNPADFMLSTGLLSMTLATRGKHGEARDMLDELEQLLNELPGASIPVAPILTCMALTAIMVGDYKRIMKFYPQLLAYRGQHYLFLVDRVLGELAARCSNWEEAHLHLHDAEVIATSRGLRPELARILFAEAHCEIASGTVESERHAVDILKTALHICEELRMTQAASEAHSWLRKLIAHQLELSSPPQPDLKSQKPQTLPGNLTRSEARVLQLVVHGKSNRLIAQELCISEKTVANHLSHIFSKTTSENRAAATAFAVRNGFA